MTETRTVGNLSQVVPQITYDLIARLIPGILLLGLASLIWYEDLRQVKFPGDVSIVDIWSYRFLPVILLIAYFLVQFLESIWYQTIDEWLKNKYRAAEQGLAEECLKGARARERGMDIKSHRFPEIAFIYDAIRLKNPVAGARIVKIRAEMQMYRNCFLGVSFIFAGSVISLFFHDRVAVDLLILLGLAVVLVLLFMQAIYRRRRLVWALYNHWLILFEPQLSELLDA